MAPFSTSELLSERPILRSRELYIFHTVHRPLDRGVRSGIGFEYDPVNCAENRRKHGIDFENALALWSDDALVEIPARVVDDARWLVIGKIADKHWSAVITRRDEDIRLISVRRSRIEELALHESEAI